MLPVRHDRPTGARRTLFNPNTDLPELLQKLGLALFWRVAPAKLGDFALYFSEIHFLTR